MKVAVLSESEADEAALRIPVEGLLGGSTEAVGQFRLRHRGVDAVRRQVHPVLSYLYYHTEARGLVVVVDSDQTPIPA